VPYDTDNPRYILSRGASFGTSFIPGLTQLINGEYVKGSLIIAGTIGATALSIAAGTGALNEMYRSDDSYPPEERALAFGALAFGGLVYSYIDGTVSTHRLNNQKEGKTTTAEETDEQSSPSEYSEIVQVPGISAQDLYIKVNVWFVDTFNNAESVIQFSDKNAGIIKGRYKYAGFYRIFSTITVEIRDGRYKITCSDPYNELGKMQDKSMLNSIYKNWETLSADLKNYILTQDDTNW
jgi:hypothetical protein